MQSTPVLQPGASPLSAPQAGAAADGSQGAGGDNAENAARLARLARKAESARLARLRHKQFVQDKQNEVIALQQEEETLLAEEEAASRGALESVRSELRRALTAEQMQLLNGWLIESEGGADSSRCTSRQRARVASHRRPHTHRRSLCCLRPCLASITRALRRRRRPPRPLRPSLPTVTATNPPLLRQLRQEAAFE